MRKKNKNKKKTARLKSYRLAQKLSEVFKAYDFDHTFKSET